MILSKNPAQEEWQVYVKNFQPAKIKALSCFVVLYGSAMAVIAAAWRTMRKKDTLK